MINIFVINKKTRNKPNKHKTYEMKIKLNAQFPLLSGALSCGDCGR